LSPTMFLVSYGTGAIMAVPGHDERDWDFAKKFDLPIVEVVQGGDITQDAYTDCKTAIMVNSGLLDGLTWRKPRRRSPSGWKEQGWGEPKSTISCATGYSPGSGTGASPFPWSYCEKCGWVPLPRGSAAAALPEVESYEPTGRRGIPALAALEDWVNHLPQMRRPASGKPIPCPVGRFQLVLPAVLRSAQQRALASRRRSSTGLPSTGTTAAWSTPRCTCSIPGSGTSSSMISAWFPRPEPYARAPATA
jgi:hypothetical protein